MTKRQEAKAYVLFNDPQWSNPAELREDLDRVFDICHGCRLCFNLCPSFPALFDAVDAHEDEVAGLTPDEIDRVEDGCYQCKLCYPKCPYIPPHSFMLDFPRLMLRLKEDKLRRAGGASFAAKQMANTDLLGKVGTAAAPILNATNASPVARRAMSAVADIHPDKLLPYYASESFEDWFRRTRPGGKSRVADPVARVAFFVTCSVNWNEVEIGKAAVEVLERNRVEVVVPPQRCCGMPRMDIADFEGCRTAMTHNALGLAPYVDAGYTVVTPGPSCSLMFRDEYPKLAAGRTAEETVNKVAAATRDVCEFLVGLHAKGQLDTNFAEPQGRIAYHFPCHLKAQNIGIRSRDLLALIPGTEVTVTERCSGHDGTWAMKNAHFDESQKIARKLTGPMLRTEPDQLATDCALAGLNVRQASGHRALHPIQIVARAYGIPGVVREGA